MFTDLPKCRITVLKRTIHQGLIDEYLDDSYQDTDYSYHRLHGLVQAGNLQGGEDG